MKHYDPLEAPDPEMWLSLDESERIVLAKTYHQRARIRLPNANVHAALHAIVETQVALGDEIPVRQTLDRLMEEGLDRHEAVHAIASVLSEAMLDISHGKPTPPDPNAAYFAALGKLTIERWREAYR
jgi:Domain of unknown function (DUF1841)